MPKNKKNNKPRRADCVSLAGMCQTVLIGAINKGQMLPALFGLIILVSVLRLPPERLWTFWQEVFLGLRNGTFAGWALGILMAAGWFWHAKWQRRTQNDELSRVSDERTNWQTAALGSDSIATSE